MVLCLLYVTEFVICAYDRGVLVMGCFMLFSVIRVCSVLQFASCSPTDGWSGTAFSGTSCSGEQRSSAAAGISGQCTSGIAGLSGRVECNAAGTLTWSIGALIAIVLGAAVARTL